MPSGSELILVIIIGLIGGVVVGIQGPMSGTISQTLGPISSSFIIHLGGTILSAVLLVLRGGENLKDWRSLPAPFFFAGAFGVILYMTFSYTLPRIGAATTTVLLIAAQLVLALVIDQMGWFGVTQQSITATRLLGVALLLVAGFLLTR